MLRTFRIDDDRGLPLARSVHAREQVSGVRYSPRLAIGSSDRLERPTMDGEIRFEGDDADAPSAQHKKTYIEPAR